MSGRDRDMGRQYESGAAKRKAKEERVARETSFDQNAKVN